MNKIETRNQTTCDHLIKDVQQIAKQLGVKKLSLNAYTKNGGVYGEMQFNRRFGNWGNCLKLAGLNPAYNRPINTEELFENIDRVWKALDQVPTQSDMNNRLISAFSVHPYKLRFETWQHTLNEYFKWKSGDPNIQTKLRPSNQISATTRYHVLKSQNATCQLCGASPRHNPNTKLHVDHIIPLSKGGTSDPTNLQTLCELCNLGKGKFSPCQPVENGI